MIFLTVLRQSPRVLSSSAVCSSVRAFNVTSNQNQSESKQYNNLCSLEDKNIENNRSISKEILSTQSDRENKPTISTSQTNFLKTQNMSSFNYPIANRSELVETLHGVDVSDPYRWMEDPYLKDTQDFVKAQNEISEKYIATCPHLSNITQTLEKNQNYEKVGPTFKRGGKYYFFKNSGLQHHSVLYEQSTLSSEERVVIDPNQLSEDGTVSLAQISFSKDGKWLAYGLTDGGSDWIEISVRNLETNQDLPEKLSKVKFTTIVWTHDSKGFFYARFPDAVGNIDGTNTNKNENHKLYYHKLQTNQSEDVLKVEFKDHSKWNIGFQLSDDGKTLHVFPRDGCQDVLWYYADISNSKPDEQLKLSPIYEKFDSEFEYLSNDGDTVYFRTNQNAPNYRVVKMNVKQPQVENWIDLISNHPEDVLDSAEIYTVGEKNYILVNYLRKVVYYLELHELGGKLIKAIQNPLGTISKYSGYRYDEEVFYQVTSFVSPGKSYHLDLKNLDNGPKLLRQSKPDGFNSDDFVVEQVFYKSDDNVDVPMFIVHKKDIKLDGTNPCLLYGYGGFNVLITSTFNANRLVWLQNFNGIFAVANIRGGGENGQEWHEAGRLLRKQQCFNDFIAAGEYLINKKYTNRDKLAIEGGSNGGLLVAAVSNQRPDLFGANICHVGVLDMLRYHKFTIGHAWMGEYGDPDEKTHFENLLKYSPYHNVPNDTSHYPATFILTGEFDDRVVASHSLKYAAELQSKLGTKLPTTPFLVRIDTKSGHGGASSLTKRMKEFGDIYAFLYNSLNLSVSF